MCLNSVKIWKLQKKELSCPVWDLLFTVCLHDPIQRASLKSSLMFWMDYHPKMVQCLKQPHTVGFFWNGSLNNHSKIKTDYISKRQFNSHIMRCNSIAVTVHLWYSIACQRALTAVISKSSSVDRQTASGRIFLSIQPWSCGGEVSVS